MTTGNLRHFGETDQRGEIVWHPVFLDFARYWDFTPRLCRPYRYYTWGAATPSALESIKGSVALARGARPAEAPAALR